MNQKPKLETPSDVQKIIAAFLAQDNQWRTIHGIAQAADLSETSVQQLIHSHPHLFSRSDISIGGIRLYALHPVAARVEAMYKRRPYRTVVRSATRNTKESSVLRSERF